jgi:NAD(P)-dependent dehydrogenase (short-subunit alcohol dehydrogenase family)
MQLEGKIAIVTGGGRGIGKSIAKVFAGEGADLVIAARTEAPLKETAAEIEAMGRKCLAIVTDQAIPEQISSTVDRTLERFGRVDVLVNNAGIGGPSMSVADMDLEGWNQTLTINLTGAMLYSKYVLKNDMIPRKSGNIINISSVAGMSGVPKESPYAVSKWGVIGFTETLAIEAGRSGLRVNCISPGATRTQEFEDWVKVSAADAGISYEEMMGKITDNNALKRIAEPSEIATCVVFLASDDSSAMTGHNLVVSCGFHLIHPNMIH